MILPPIKISGLPSPVISINQIIEVITETPLPKPFQAAGFFLAISPDFSGIFSLYVENIPSTLPHIYFRYGLGPAVFTALPRRQKSIIELRRSLSRLEDTFLGGPYGVARAGSIEHPQITNIIILKRRLKYDLSMKPPVICIS